jgi:hypothetical protein
MQINIIKKVDKTLKTDTKKFIIPCPGGACLPVGR